jgi:hypothetical protein
MDYKRVLDEIQEFYRIQMNFFLEIEDVLETPT